MSNVSQMNKKVLQVLYKERLVGTLAETERGYVAFQYDETWLREGFSISPFSLPLKEGVFLPKNYNFEGLFGVFADSLPDAWGRLLLDRKLAAEGIKLGEVTLLDRLSIIGSSGMGALEYRPIHPFAPIVEEKTFDEISEACNKILSSKKCDDLDLILQLGGPSGGARPKALMEIDGEEWIVKFPYSKDPAGSGGREYEYSILARKLGIDMPQTRLFPSKKCEGYFGIKRFDRPKVHMISAAALLEADFETSVLDYADVFKLTRILTAGNKSDLENLYLRMCFNVAIDNQDDHLKNFSFLYDDEKQMWRLSPAYDLTDTKTSYGEHTTLVGGKGTNITTEDLISVGEAAGLDPAWCKKAAGKVNRVVK